MPPILIYRNSTKTVLPIVFKSMPVGAYKNFPYKEKTLEMQSGDVIFVLSDGLPELFNKEKEMFEYERITNKLEELGALKSQDIINRFVESTNDWLGNKSPDDDITLMAIKFN
jgi:serine phosphatase RsbU (regulator of sigma subunit)